MIPYQIIITRGLNGGFFLAIIKERHFPNNEPALHYAADLTELKKLLGEIYGWPRAGRPKKDG